VEFYKKAFGAEESIVMKMPDGRLMHAGLSINGATVMLAEEMPECAALSPQSLGGTTITLHLEVPDCDAVFQRAVEAGCEAVMPPQDMFWGARYGQVTDPYGHRWAIATTTRQVSPEEMQKAFESMPCGQ
jgi:uncharacterized glyoxalase superfamily protein PhnB